jgi:hypothetical protein
MRLVDGFEGIVFSEALAAKGAVVFGRSVGQRITQA